MQRNGGPNGPRDDDEQPTPRNRRDTLWLNSHGRFDQPAPRDSTMPVNPQVPAGRFEAVGDTRNQVRTLLGTTGPGGNVNPSTPSPYTGGPVDEDAARNALRALGNSPGTPNMPAPTGSYPGGPVDEDAVRNDLRRLLGNSPGSPNTPAPTAPYTGGAVDEGAVHNDLRRLLGNSPNVPTPAPGGVDEDSVRNDLRRLLGGPSPTPNAPTGDQAIRDQLSVLGAASQPVAASGYDWSRPVEQQYGEYAALMQQHGLESVPFNIYRQGVEETRALLPKTKAQPRRRPRTVDEALNLSYPDDPGRVV